MVLLLRLAYALFFCPLNSLQFSGKKAAIQQ